MSGWIDEYGIAYGYNDVGETDEEMEERLKEKYGDEFNHIISSIENSEVELESGNYNVMVTPDPAFNETIMNECSHGRVEPDELSFGKVLQKKYDIFLKRKKKYGNHIDNAKRFPKEHRGFLYGKCARLIRMIEGDCVDEDTLLDLSNYCDIILSSINIDE